MASKGQEIRSSGLTLRIVELESDLLVMDAEYEAGAGMPPPHYHPSQTETFTIVEGRMKTIVDGSETVYEAGDTFDVPPATLHQMAPEGGRARTRWEVRPALRTADFFEVLLTGKAGENFLEEFKDEIRFG
jgi:mannose-6-phosphate isomerase-like protein (cupin superfamily)